MPTPKLATTVGGRSGRRGASRGGGSPPPAPGIRGAGGRRPCATPNDGAMATSPPSTIASNGTHNQYASPAERTYSHPCDHHDRDASLASAVFGTSES